MSKNQKHALSWDVKSFDELTARELHDLLKVRVDVFVVEQECAYPEIDGKDLQCYHLLGKDNFGTTKATARIVPTDIIYSETSIGRIAVDQNLRGKGYGKTIMEKSIAFCVEKLNAPSIKIAGQLYLKRFYTDFGFSQISEVYLWDGIEHIDMRLVI